MSVLTDVLNNPAKAAAELQRLHSIEAQNERLLEYNQELGRLANTQQDEILRLQARIMELENVTGSR